MTHILPTQMSVKKIVIPEQPTDFTINKRFTCPPVQLKQNIGCLRYQATCSCPTCLMIQSTLKASWSVVMKPDTYIGKLSSSCPDNAGSPQSRSVLETSVMPSPVALPRLRHTYGKRIQPLPVQSLNWDLNPSEEIHVKIGTTYYEMLDAEIWTQYLPMFLFAITAHSKRSLSKIVRRLESSGKFMFSGERPTVERVTGHGVRPAWRHTLRILAPSSGTVTEARNLLSSMSSGELLECHICSDGSTNIRFLLK
jgi:hypothetical protein